jgi:hypothetical protein
MYRVIKAGLSKITKLTGRLQLPSNGCVTLWPARSPKKTARDFRRASSAAASS